MLTLDLMLKLLPVFVLAIAAVEYLRRIHRGIEDILELQWRNTDLLADALGSERIGNEFLSRSGRVVRRRRIQSDA
jgi:hypothetical protein